MKVFVDDIRDKKGWTIARNYKEAIDLLKNGRVTIIDLDHDLGEGKTGYDIAKWIEREVFANRLYPPKIQIHTQNPVGRANIQRCIDRLR